MRNWGFAAFCRNAVVATRFLCQRSHDRTNGAAAALCCALCKSDRLAFQSRRSRFAMEKVSIREKLSQFKEYWSPKIVGELNGQLVKLVKFQGEFLWHHHDHEDELFLVVKGRFRMEFRDHQVWLDEGEFLIVPRGLEHRPVAPVEAHVLLFEPATTLNTGNVSNERTIRDLERI
jgi:mannose-6-phosphate isomerase-like protein (cupin superfamily)